MSAYFELKGGLVVSLGFDKRLNPKQVYERVKCFNKSRNVKVLESRIFIEIPATQKSYETYFEETKLDCLEPLPPYCGLGVDYEVHSDAHAYEFICVWDDTGCECDRRLRVMLPYRIRTYDLSSSSNIEHFFAELETIVEIFRPDDLVFCTDGTAFPYCIHIDLVENHSGVVYRDGKWQEHLSSWM